MGVLFEYVMNYMCFSCVVNFFVSFYGWFLFVKVLLYVWYLCWVVKYFWWDNMDFFIFISLVVNVVVFVDFGFKIVFVVCEV